MWGRGGQKKGSENCNVMAKIEEKNNETHIWVLKRNFLSCGDRYTGGQVINQQEI